MEITKASVYELINQLEDTVSGDEIYAILLNLGKPVVPFLLLLLNKISLETNKDKYHIVLNLLGEIGDDRAVSALVSIIENDGTETVEVALNALYKISFSAKTLPRMLGLLSSQNEQVQISVAKILGKTTNLCFCNSELINALIDLVHYSKLKVRAEAIQSLGYLSVKKVVPLLIEMLYSDRNLRKTLISALADIKSEQAITPLNKLYHEIKDVSLRREIIIALGLIGGEEGFQTVLDALKNENKDIRRSAAFALGYFTNKSAYDLLITAVENDDLFIAIEAIQSIGKIKDPRTFEYLEKIFIEHKIVLLQQAAIRGLGFLEEAKAFKLIAPFLKSPSPDLRDRFKTNHLVKRLRSKRDIAINNQHSAFSAKRS